MLQVSPISPGPTVPPSVTVSTWATGTTLAVVVAPAAGGLVEYVAATVLPAPAAAAANVPPAVSDWIRIRLALFGSATAVTPRPAALIWLISEVRAAATLEGPATVNGAPLPATFTLSVSPAM